MSDETLTDEELNEIEARAAAATPGPWHVDGRHEHERGGGIDFIESEAGRQIVCGDSGAYPPVLTDADFIAAARTDVPRLVAALRAEREPVDWPKLEAEHAPVIALIRALPEIGTDAEQERRRVLIARRAEMITAVATRIAAWLRSRMTELGRRRTAGEWADAIEQEAARGTFSEVDRG